MKETKKHPEQPETEPVNVEVEILPAEGTDEAAAGGTGQQAEIDKLQAEKTELINTLQRLQADFENFRRRTRLEKEDFYKYASEGVLSQLLPIVDNFERALAAAKDGETKNFIPGVEMIFRQLTQLMEKEGMAAIEAVGCPFDPNVHEAVMQVEDKNSPKDTVLEVLQKGYTLKGKLLRPSVVKVSQ